MADDVRELTFNNDYYDESGNPVATYSGTFAVDFTTNTIVSGTFVDDGYTFSAADLSFSGPNASGQYTISASHSVFNRNEGANDSWRGSVTFTGEKPLSLDSASYGRTYGPLGVRAKRSTYGISTSGTTELERPVKTDSLPSVTFNDTTSGFKNGVTAVLKGTVSNTFDLAGIESYDGESVRGAATVSCNTWTFTDNFGSGDYANLTAVATSNLGNTASATAPYELVTGVTGQPYRAIEYDYAPDGSYGYTIHDSHGATIVTATNNADGTHTIKAFVPNQELYSAGKDTMLGNGSNETFVFSQGFGHDRIENFGVTGAGHDYLDLTGTQITTLAAALNHTTQVGGNAVLHLYGNETVTLDGVTKAQLKAHPGDFLLA